MIRTHVEGVSVHRSAVKSETTHKAHVNEPPQSAEAWEHRVVLINRPKHGCSCPRRDLGRVINHGVLGNLCASRG